jgi:hypothetical protein
MINNLLEFNLEINLRFYKEELIKNRHLIFEELIEVFYILLTIYKLINIDILY